MNTLLVTAAVWVGVSILTGLAAGRFIGMMGDDEAADALEQLPQPASSGARGRAAGGSLVAALSANQAGGAGPQTARRQASRSMPRRGANRPRKAGSGR